MDYGTRVIQKGHKGPDVEELQLRLAGFRGTSPDGDYGPGTERQVVAFQRDYMRLPNQSGIVDKPTMEAIEDLGAKFPLDFAALRCKCGVCGGFGRGGSTGIYRAGKPEVEAYYQYEYPGIHRMLLWAVKAIFFYMPQYNFSINSGYRCSIDNQQHGRTSTNHHGKAIDIDVPRRSGEGVEEDKVRCNEIRDKLVEVSNAQIGWAAGNRKSLEPANIAPTWVHYDVRNYARKYLPDQLFCQSEEALIGSFSIQI